MDSTPVASSLSSAPTSSASGSAGPPSQSLSPISDYVVTVPAEVEVEVEVELPDQPGARHQSTTAAGPEAQRDRLTVPSACVACRSKHLKCDGQSPCSRCSSSELECVYVRSRRGFKGPRKKLAAQTPATSTLADGTNPICPLTGARRLQSSDSSPSPFVPNGLANALDQRLRSLDAASLPAMESALSLAWDSELDISWLDLRSRCTEAFFFHFWPAHPFVLPRENLLRVFREKSLEHLEAAIRYVGSFYVTQAPTAAYCLEAERSIYRADCPRDGFMVQAMLILSIGLDGYTHQEKALEILTDAQKLALELGMNSREFASAHGDRWPMMEESWRRTWWEMFVIDGMIAGVHQKSFFPMKDILADVELPCEEAEFLSGTIPPPHSLADFDDEAFLDRGFTYSSFAYRVSAIRNLGRMITSKMTMTVPDPGVVDRLDAYLVNWRLHLPESKRMLVNHSGQLDEMLFQGNMITEAATIVLHRDLSELDSSPARTIVSCAPHHPVLPGQSYNVHASKCVSAAQAISKLITLPVPLSKHTHFFTCVVTLASIIHLSCWSVLYPSIQDDDLKQHLKLNTGALKTLRQIWPSAGPAFGQVKGVASEMLERKKEELEAGRWGAWTEDQARGRMLNDQSYMEELQLL